MENEEWRELTGYKNYQISNLGRIRSLAKVVRPSNPYLSKGKMLSQYYNDSGYLCVGISLHRKTHPERIHRLMAQAFIPNPSSLPCVLHINGIRDDNRLDNLYWGTKKDNAEDAIKHGTFQGFKNKGKIIKSTRLNESQAKMIKNALFYNAIPKELAKIFRVNIETIKRIKKCHTWKHITI